jgi:hypothetical protein
MVDLENNEKNSLYDDAYSHDKITVGDVIGSGIVIGKNIKVGSINTNSLNKELQKVPNEYANSL